MASSPSISILVFVISLVSSGSFGAKVDVPDGALRLTHGTAPFNGRVEVYHNGRWGSVCKDGFGHYEAKLVCEKLGFSWGYHMIHNDTFFGESSGPIWLDELNCGKYTTDIASCRTQDWGVHDCTHKQDVGLTCLDEGTLKLYGSKPYEGRVDLYAKYSSSGIDWGSIYDPYFGLNEAEVVCRVIGYPGAKKTYTIKLTGGYYDYKWLTYLKCSQYSTNVASCRTKDWIYTSSSSFSNVVGVTCLNFMRLANGTSEGNGRVEVFHKGRWGTICDDGFGMNEANAVCRQMGYSGAAHVQPEGFYGAGTGDIWLDGLECPPGAPNITACSARRWGSHDCTHEHDVGITCAADGAFRLVGGTNPRNGRVEVYYNGRWGTVCDKYVGPYAARMICRSIGYPDALNIHVDAYFGEGSGDIWLDGLQCSSEARSIADCKTPVWTSTGCTHSNDVGLTCRAPKDRVTTDPEDGEVDQDSADNMAPGITEKIPNGALRLANSPAEGSGRVEVYYKGTWGTICDRGFGLYDAIFVCRKLGFPGAEEAHPGAYFGQGPGPILLSELACDVNSTDVTACMTRGWGQHDCSHEQDAGVTCTLPEVEDLAQADLYAQASVQMDLQAWSAYTTDSTFEAEEFMPDLEDGPDADIDLGPEYEYDEESVILSNLLQKKDEVSDPDKKNDIEYIPAIEG